MIKNQSATLPSSLVLANGQSFVGMAPAWQQGQYFGEVVFNTGMTGYVETLTDPSYAGQILTFTYPLLGNYGVPDSTLWESPRIHARGVILQTACASPSHYDSQRNFLQWLEQEKIPALLEVDTRALTKVLREQGVAMGAIVCNAEMPKQFGDFSTQDWMNQVSIKEPKQYGHGTKKIIAVDCGMKENIMRELMRFPISIKRVPHDYDYSQEEFDGLFISNGPGDPMQCQRTVDILAKAMKRDKPIFGICLGTQLMALAIGASTYKLRYGHRGQNQPCFDIQRNRAVLTSQNHGYAIEASSLPADWEVSFTHLNDNTIAGIQHKEKPWYSVQFHPEAAAGPHDTHYLFERFYQSL